MPVKILNSFPLTPGSSFVLKGELDKGMAIFADTYLINATPPSNKFTKSIKIAWQDLIDTVIKPVTDLSGPTPIDPADLVLRFYHRYDKASAAWFLTLDCWKKTGLTTDPTGQGLKAFSITGIGPQFDLVDGEKIARSTFTGIDHDDVYFGDLCYFDGTNYNKLDTSIHVKSLVLPWANEILQMYNENYPSGPPSLPVYLIIASCSFYYDTTASTAFSNIEYPHGIVLYLNENGKDLLDDNTSGTGNYVTMYCNHGEDFSTMCPPNSNCPVYITPADVVGNPISNFIR